MYLDRTEILIYKLLLPLVYFLLVNVSRSEIRCVEREREALLRFKQGLNDEYGYLSSWGSDHECCEWSAISCSNISGRAHVTQIYLYGYYLGGNITSDLLDLQHLQYLDFTFNNFGGSIPKFLGSMKSLEDLRLSYNHFTGRIPDELGNLTGLSVLTLNFNSLEHEIPKSFVNLTVLQYFFVNVNLLGEPLADLFGKLSCKALESIDVSFNDFTGPFPDLRACSKLREIRFEHTLVSGSLPTSLGQLSTLEFIDVSVTLLQGTINESHFSKLDRLKSLDFSLDSFSLDFRADWIPPFRLQSINLQRCKMGPSFPAWLQTQTDVSSLDISDAGISDRVPDWLWSLSPKLTSFNISQNQISGTLPPDISSNFLGKIDVSSNSLSGALPLLHPNVTLAQFSQNAFSGTISSICQVSRTQLVFLDLSNNQFSGEIPSCWDNTTALEFFNLNNNGFDGEIPPALGSLRSLKTLHLRGNNLSGQLPPTLKNCISLLLIDIGGNELTGNIPVWLGENFANLTHLSLRRNRFHGPIPAEICHLTRIQMLDLSGNELSGEIPLCFDNFTSLADKNGSISEPISYHMDFNRDYFDYVQVQWKGRDSEYRKALRLLKLVDLSSNGLVGNIPEAFSSLKGLISLNLSANSLGGRIDPSIGEMEMLETLDLSNNHLSGNIPAGLAKLSFLSVLDLANNKLSGEIPVGTQLGGFNASVYSGNDGLCGPPLPLCPNATSVDNEGESEDGGGFNISLQEFGLPLILGYAVGFWGILASLLVKRSWRVAYFGFINAVGDWLCDATTMFLAKFTRP